MTLFSIIKTSLIVYLIVKLFESIISKYIIYKIFKNSRFKVEYIFEALISSLSLILGGNLKIIFTIPKFFMLIATILIAYLIVTFIKYVIYSSSKSFLSFMIYTVLITYGIPFVAKLFFNYY